MSPIPLDARHIANQQGDFSPQHQNNWMIEISGLAGDAKDLLVLSLISAALPNEKNAEVTMKYGNEERHVAGAVSYDAIPLVVRDYVDRDTRKALLDWRLQVYDPNTGLIGLPSDYKKNAEIIVMAPNNTHQRVCRLIGVWPTGITGGTLTMDNAEPVTIEVPLRYDRAIWKL